ncbi:hypothetical protein C8R43DRAFT_1117349 [Mycena crocata]|nr:hypothetical protein C8R43DRAFT_1117349 [Mycena crocata]
MTSSTTIGPWVEEFNSKPPVLHAGPMTPLLLSDFSAAANTYFDFKKVDVAEHVVAVIGNIRDQEFKNWIRDRPTCTRLNAMTFEDFMTTVAAKFLDATWEIDTRYTIAQLRQKIDQKFSSYATEVPARPVALDELDAWRVEVDRVDDKRLADRLKQMRIPEVLHHTETLKRKADTDGDRSSKKLLSTSSSKPVSTSSTSSTRTRNCPKLTEDEKTLLDDNNGCQKCCRFFIGHVGHNCPNDWPDAASYETLTQAHVDRARANAKGKSKATAITVSAVIPNVDDSDDSIGTEDDLSREVSTPISFPQLVWDCLIEGPMSNLPVEIHALINHGSGLVLIDSDVADALALRRFQLHKPLNISLAFADPSNPAPTLLSKYVKLALHSRDNSWTSNTVRVIVAPNLCAPVILGLPWLARNQIVVDHHARTVIDKRCGFDLLHPPEPKAAAAPKIKLREQVKKTKHDHKEMAKELKTVCDARRLHLEKENLFEDVKPVNVIAIREHIEVLAHWEELNTIADKLKNEHSCLFEPMPHVNDLPTDVLCEIKLKDADLAFRSR